MARGRPRGTRLVAPATDLTAPAGALSALNDLPVDEVARATLAAGRSLLSAWGELEPLVRTLTERVKGHLSAKETDLATSAKLLGLCANVVQKVGAAATGVLRTTDGLSRLTLVLRGPGERPAPAHLSEKQLATVVIETVKRIAAERGGCPVCTKTIEVRPDV